MRIGRAIIIPAILALGVAGSVLAGSAAPAVAAQRPVSTCRRPVSSDNPDMYTTT